MDYNLLIKRLRAHKIKTDFGRFKPDICEKAATAIETLLAERDAAVKDLGEFAESGEACHFCKHLPCHPENDHCIGWEWRGSKKGEAHGNQ